MGRASATTARLRPLLLLCTLLHCARAFPQVTDEEYYSMPALFELDGWAGCAAQRAAYCMGTFELRAPPAHAHRVYDIMQRVTANWVDNFNHTQLHRALCLERSCAAHRDRAQSDVVWFSKCVNASVWSSHGLTARLARVQYCARAPAAPPPLDASERGFAAVFAALLALAALSTVLDLTLSPHARKGREWALAWSVPGCWRALQAPPPASAETDLRAFDGLRVLCLMCVIVEHVCWLATQAYLADTREFELMRRTWDVMLMVNSTLVVQIFFLMSSFLLAHKLLQQRRRALAPPAHAFCDTMLNRIVRVSPSYFLMVWFAATWWARLGRGPLWPPMVQAESAVCRRKWWTHLLYLNNVIYPDDKCLIQTWYLAADMQLYALSLLTTLALLRWRRGALGVLGALLAACVALLAALAYHWRLVPTYFMHRPEGVRAAYSGSWSFNVLYQSPLGNAPGALVGLLLAQLHHQLLDHGVKLDQYKVFRWVSVASPFIATVWAASSPRLLGAGEPPRAAAAALAAVERPVFSLFVALGLLGAMHNIDSPLRTLFSWRGWATPARLSFGVLLLHMPLNKWLVAARLAPAQVTRQIAIYEWFGVALVSYACAVPLALLVELPAQRLQRALARRAPAPAPVPQQEKTDL